MARVAFLQALQAKFLVTLPLFIYVALLDKVTRAKVELAGVLA